MHLPAVRNISKRQLNLNDSKIKLMKLKIIYNYRSQVGELKPIQIFVVKAPVQILKMFCFAKHCIVPTVWILVYRDDRISRYQDKAQSAAP